MGAFCIGSDTIYRGRLLGSCAHRCIIYWVVVDLWYIQIGFKFAETLKC